jgi:hypothetical protein
MFYITVDNYGRSAKQFNMVVEHSTFSFELSCQNMLYILAGKTYLGEIKYLKLISNKKLNRQMMIEITKFTSDYSQTFNSAFLPLYIKNIKNG